MERKMIESDRQKKMEAKENDKSENIFGIKFRIG